MLEIIPTEISGVLIIKPRVFEDSRGVFFESFNETLFREKNLPVNFVQDNQSTSKKGVIRGLHFQKPPFAQGKLVRVVKGSAWDVAVDIRKESKTYGKHISVELSEENNLMLWIPEGFAHGFSALVNGTIFCYKCTNFYNKKSEDGILWNDPDLNINWKVKNPLVSEKDRELQTFKQLISEF